MHLWGEGFYRKLRKWRESAEREQAMERLTAINFGNMHNLRE